MIRFPVVSQRFTKCSLTILLLIFIAVLALAAPALAANQPPAWVKPPANVTYTDRSYTITWANQKADQVALYYVLGGKEYPITKLDAGTTSYRWNPPDEPDPAHTTHTVFHYVRIKALWRDRVGEGYKNVSTAYSDYFTLVKPGSFVIINQSLPPAVLNESYRADLKAAGGETPYHWSIKSGILPDGLTLNGNGQIRGTPTGVRPQTVTFQAMDAGVDPLYDTIDLTIDILKPGQPATPTPEPFDYDIVDIIGPIYLTRPADGYETVSTRMRVMQLDGTPATVSMDLTGCPAGVDYAFTPRSAVCNGSFDTHLNFTASNRAAPGNYDIVVHATTATGLDKTESFTLNVTSAATIGDLILRKPYDLVDAIQSETCILPVQVNDGIGWAIKDKNTVFRTTIASTFNTDKDVQVELWLPTEDWTWEGQTPRSGSSLVTDGMGTYNCPEHYVYSTTVTVPANGEIEIVMPDATAFVNETIHSSPHHAFDQYSFVSNAPRPSHTGYDRAEAPEYTVVVDPYDRITETNEHNNYPYPRGYESIATYKSSTLNVFFSPVISDNYDVEDFWPGGVDGTAFARDWNDNMTPQARDSIEYMIGVYPVSDDGKISYYLNPGLLTTHAHGSSSDREQVHIQEDLADMAAENGYDRIVAFVPISGWYGSSSDWNGVVWNHNTRACFVRINRNKTTTMTHENYHNLGYPDIDSQSNPGDFPADDGYWVNKGQDKDVAADDVRDYMDYTGQPRWSTIGDYQNVRAHIPRSDDPPVLLFRCLLSKNGSLDLKPFMVVDGRPDVEPAEWSHKIVLKDGSGNVVREQKVLVSFTASLDMDPGSTAGTVNEVDEAFISSTVLWSNNVSTVELRDKSGMLLASRAVSKNPPAVQFTAPAAGDVWAYGNTYKLKWTASDPDGDALNFSLAMSTDKATWIPVAIDIASNEYEFDTKAAQPGNYYFRVRATDGVLSVNDTLEQSIRITGESSLPAQSGTATPIPSPGQSGLPGMVMVIGAIIAVVLAVGVIAVAFLVLRSKK